MNNKMNNKIKISGISSETYPEGRLDILRFKFQNNLIEPFQKLFKDLDFSEEMIEKLDINYSSSKGVRFFYSNKIKIHMFFDNEGIYLVIDSQMEKINLSRIIEKYFQFP